MAGFALTKNEICVCCLNTVDKFVTPLPIYSAESVRYLCVFDSDMLVCMCCTSACIS